MKSISNTYRIFALTMAFVMFTSSVNIAMDMHYCLGKLKSVSFIGKAETCHDMASAKMPNCPQHQEMKGESDGCSISKKDCCDNKSVHIQSDIDELETSSELVVSQQLQNFIVAYVEVFFKNNYIERTAQSFQYYHPPIVVKDIPVLHQTFLI